MQWGEEQKKQLTATGAVSTDGTAGLLLYVYATGDTAGDTIAIKDGATTVFTMIIPAANGACEPLDFRPDGLPFTTDIDCAITTANNVYASFIYREAT